MKKDLIKNIKISNISEAEDILKSIDNISIEKAVYADTPQNRKLGRVGQEYHRGKGKKEEESNKKSSKLSKLDSDLIRGDLKNIKDKLLGKNMVVQYKQGDINISGKVLDIEEKKMSLPTYGQKTSKNTLTKKYAVLEDGQKIELNMSLKYPDYKIYFK